MKGIILAGGTGSRLKPLTKITNKHLLPVGKYPMIYYSIKKMVDCDIKEIMIVTGRNHMGDIVQLLGSGRHLGAALTYRIQDEPGGVAHALWFANAFAAGESVFVILGDNIFEDDISDIVKSFTSGAKVFLKEVSDPKRFGVAEILDKKIIKIEEKPETPKTNYAVTGIYLYDNKIFDIIKKIKPSPRGELEITDVNNEYIKLNEMNFNILNGWWVDAGTHESYSIVNNYAKNINLGEKFNE